jgi:hypothetical protein
LMVGAYIECLTTASDSNAHKPILLAPHVTYSTDRLFLP